MSHPKGLIEAILAQVESDYSASSHSFQIERAIPGTRMHPDILVRDRYGAIVCAVEIGYTRPEKLTKYRQLGIPDVRWYDKAGSLHPGWETVHVRAEVAFAEPREVAVYDIGLGILACSACYVLADDDDEEVAFEEA